VFFSLSNFLIVTTKAINKATATTVTIAGSINSMYINNKYIREEELELDKLFKIEDVTDTVFLKQEEIKKLKNIMKA